MDHLKEALVLTQQMLAFSEAGEWEKVNDAHQKRENCLNRSTAVNVDSSIAVTLLEEILDLNTKIAQSANLEKERSLQSYVSLKHGKKAVQAYR